MLILCLFSLHKTIQKGKNNITPYGENFHQLTYWDKIKKKKKKKKKENLEGYIS